MPRILYIQYTNPGGYPPLEHSSRILADAGWKVFFLGTGALGSNALEFPAHQNVTVRRMRFCPAGWRQKLHYVGYCFWVLWMTMVWRPRWVYASDPLSCPIAAILSWIPGVKLLYHEHDSPAFSEPQATGGVAGGWVNVFRRVLAKRADCCVLPNQSRLERFKAETARRGDTLCVWNCAAKNETGAATPKARTQTLRVLYHGSIVPARLPLTVLGALASCPESVTLTVVGYETIGSEGYLREFRQRAITLGVAHRLSISGALSRSALLDCCRSHDVGLSFMPMRSADINMTAMTGASNKPFDYMACGLALLVSDLEEWRQAFVNPGYGLACNPEVPASIAAALRSFLDDPARMHSMGELGRQRIFADWNYEKRFKPVFDLICQAS